MEQKNNKLIHSIWKMYMYIKGKKEIFDLKKYTKKRKFRKLKKSKVGKRCFIVGNGPSLTIEDLEKIKNEDSFAVNRIYKIFSDTTWRPTYYCSQDTKVLEEVGENIDAVLGGCKEVFLNSAAAANISKEYREKDNIYFFYLNTKRYYPQLPDFSENIKEIFEGFTVAYACIQIAVYMGYSEIYIIGTDHNYNVNLTQDGKVESDNNVSNYMKGLEADLGFLPQLQNSTLAFRKARKICDEKGIIIKNATRGGKLEEFERVEFDTLF